MTLKYYSGNRITGTASERGSLSTTNLLDFTNFHETDTDDVYTWDGDSWNIVASNTGAETLANKTLTAPTVNAGTLNLMTAFTVANDIDVGAYEVKALKFESDQATGTAPLTVASTTVVTNLNADLLDGVQGAAYTTLTGSETLTNKTLTAPVFATYLDFTKISAPSDPGTEVARMYLKEIDANNNAIAVKVQKAWAIVEVEITSPKAVCGVCGSKDGAKDPTYDFDRSTMLLELYCGHSYEVPMTDWTRVA